MILEKQGEVQEGLLDRLQTIMFVLVSPQSSAGYTFYLVQITSSLSMLFVNSNSLKHIQHNCQLLIIWKQ